MIASYKESLLENLQDIDEISNLDEKQIKEKLNDILKKVISSLTQYLNKQPATEVKTISFGEVKKDLGVRFGLKRLQNEIIFANWLLDLQFRTRLYVLSFHIIKESLIHFLDFEIKEEDEAILNIITVLLLSEIIELSSLDNPQLSAIRAKIYSEEIAGISYLYWDNLMILLLKKNVPFLEVFNIFIEISQSKQQSSQEKAADFSKWVITNTVKEENVISPIFTNTKLIKLIETLLELDYDRSTTSEIAKRTNLSQRTITKRFKALNETYSTYWLSDVNYEEMNLHKYFLKIEYSKNEITSILDDLLLKIPYLKSLFHGTDGLKSVIYTPTLICPHIISDKLRERLQKMVNNSFIDNFTIQLIRERYRYCAITNFPYDPTMKLFERLIYNGDKYLKKYTFLSEKRSSILPEKDKPILMDYNLLYFLSIITGKYLLKARYAVNINEFAKFCSEKNISLTDIEAQTDLLYQNEFRAKRKNLLSYSLYMRNLAARGSDVLIVELPIVSHQSEEELKVVIKQLQVFSFLGQ
ncbi:MAG: hypothetical protein ACFFDW_09215, partial [Candidatus Thorarchaeota archaeon]